MTTKKEDCGTIPAKYCVVWIDDEDRRVLVQDVEGVRQWLRPPAASGENWADPIGASYAQWRKMTDPQRALLMLETAIDLAMQGYDLGVILREFVKVDCFHDLGKKSFPMCRALTAALTGKCLEPTTMTFEELLAHYDFSDEATAGDVMGGT
jgi:hypothetical protein